MGEWHYRHCCQQKKCPYPEVLNSDFLKKIKKNFLFSGFIIPGFVDSHTQAFPYVNCGTNVDKQRDEFDNTGRTLQQRKASLVVNETIARDIYKQMLVNLIFFMQVLLQLSMWTMKCYLNSHLRSYVILIISHFIFKFFIIIFLFGSNIMTLYTHSTLYMYAVLKPSVALYMSQGWDLVFLTLAMGWLWNYL